MEVVDTLSNPTFWTIVSTSAATLLAAYWGYWLTGKPRLIVFSPNSSWFELRAQTEGQQPTQLKAGQVIVQNNGRKSASNVQLTAQLGIHPWAYSVMPNIDHITRTGSKGEWILEFPYLGPRETVTIQILNGPIIETIRSSEGPAKYVPVNYQRQFPTWFNLSALFFMLVGLISVFSGIIFIVLRIY